MAPSTRQSAAGSAKVSGGPPRVKGAPAMLYRFPLTNDDKAAARAAFDEYYFQMSRLKLALEKTPDTRERLDTIANFVAALVRCAVFLLMIQLSNQTLSRLCMVP